MIGQIFFLGSGGIILNSGQEVRIGSNDGMRSKEDDQMLYIIGS